MNEPPPSEGDVSDKQLHIGACAGFYLNTPRLWLRRFLSLLAVRANCRIFEAMMERLNP